MSSELKVHDGWTVSGRKKGSRLEYASRHREKRQFVSDPLELECLGAEITDEQWRQVEGWVLTTAPIPSTRIRVNLEFDCFCSEVKFVLRLNLVRAGEEFSVDQRLRINQSLRRHSHSGVPIQLSVIVRQVLRPD